MLQNKRIIIAGAGGIGRAVGLLMANYPDFGGELFIGDRKLDFANEAARWIEEGRNHPVDVHGYALPENGSSEDFNSILAQSDLILDCLPGGQAPRIARLALDHNLHYVNLTEYVAETEQIVDLAQNAGTGFVLQTGLAPGFINILAHKLYRQFIKANGDADVKHMRMRVGALTKHTISPHYYGFTWSPIGVATEYIKQSCVLRNGEICWLDALSERETLLIDGYTYEADLTSGGAADLGEYFKGRIHNVDYKTLRYPGHFGWVDTILHDVHGDNRIATLQGKMQEVIPTVEDDLIVIYASVTGRDQRGILRQVEKSYHISPMHLSGKRLRAIQSTTAAPMAECARLLLQGKWSGVVKQSVIDPDELMSGPFIDMVYNNTVKRNGVSLAV